MGTPDFQAQVRLSALLLGHLAARSGRGRPGADAEHLRLRHLVGDDDVGADALVAAWRSGRRGSLGAGPLLRELRSLGAERTSPGGTPSLTDREREVLALVAQGRSNREIGQVLYISAETVSVHVSNVLAGLQATGRTEAVAVAQRTGLLEVPPRGGV